MPMTAINRRLELIWPHVKANLRRPWGAAAYGVLWFMQWGGILTLGYVVVWPFARCMAQGNSTSQCASVALAMWTFEWWAFVLKRMWWMFGGG